jgi:hypothetical protein
MVCCVQGVQLGGVGQQVEGVHDEGVEVAGGQQRPKGWQAVLARIKS